MQSLYKIFLPMWFLILFVSALAAEGVLGDVGEDISEIVAVHGQHLKGRIQLFDSEGIAFETDFGKGEIKIEYQDIEQISSQRLYLLYYGEDQVVQGRIMGIEKGLLIIGTDQGHTVSIQMASIHTGLSVHKYKTSWLTRQRTRFRHWNASMDMGVRYERTAIDKNKLEFGLMLARRKYPTRFVFDFKYAYEFQKQSGGEELTTKDELTTFLMCEYDIRGPWFLFARPAYEYDIPRSIEGRLYPSAGFGYQVYNKKNYLLHFPIGFGYVDENFIDISKNSYPAGYIGFDGFYTFSNGIKLSGNLYYMPSLEKRDEEWLFRFDFDVKLPIVDPVALIFRITEVNDNNPTPDVGTNKFTTLLALSLDF
jgi:hypothetical protein